MCCASQSPFFSKNSGVRTHVSPGRQLDAIYESCPSSQAAARPCGWLRPLTGSLGRWRRFYSVWLATLVALWTVRDRHQGLWSCKNMRPYHEPKTVNGFGLSHRRTYIGQLSSSSSSFHFSFHRLKKVAALRQILRTGCREVQALAQTTLVGLRQTRVGNIAFGASTSPDTTSLMFLSRHDAWEKEKCQEKTHEGERCRQATKKHTHTASSCLGFRMEVQRSFGEKASRLQQTKQANGNGNGTKEKEGIFLVAGQW